MKSQVTEDSLEKVVLELNFEKWVQGSPVAEEGKEFQTEAKLTRYESHRNFEECT